jgi:hypothetical protein
MRQYYKNGNLVGGQTKIASAAKPFDEITGEDFKALKRKKAMGGGMMRKPFKRGGDVSKRTSPKKDKTIQKIKKTIRKFAPGAVDAAKKLLQETRKPFRKGGDTHVTKEGKIAKKGLWYNIAQKKKRGEKMRAKGAKGAPTEKAIKKSQA